MGNFITKQNDNVRGQFCQSKPIHHNNSIKANFKAVNLRFRLRSGNSKFYLIIDGKVIVYDAPFLDAVGFGG